MKKLFVVFAVVFLVGLVVLEIAGTGLTLAKLAFIRREKASLEGESYLVIEFPEKIVVQLEVDGKEVLGYSPDGSEVFRMDLGTEFRAKMQLAFAQIGAWVEKEPAQDQTSEGERRLFRVANASGQEGFAVIRGGKLTWLNGAGKVLQWFDLTIITDNRGLLMFQWEPRKGGK